MKNKIIIQPRIDYPREGEYTYYWYIGGKTLTSCLNGNWQNIVRLRRNAIEYRQSVYLAI